MAGRWKVVLTFNDTLADKIINSAIDNGVNLIDTTDVYEKWIE
jgi:aryl-alcohol dehydrogenase-like predicted oxidoreductase